jgi:transcription initiation factor TFIIIB Brf1 subunit/transcription initiation factor TFIIB
MEKINHNTPLQIPVIDARGNYSDSFTKNPMDEIKEKKGKKPNRGKMATSLLTTDNGKTKKKRMILSNTEKRQMWDIFEKDKMDIELHTNVDTIYEKDIPDQMDKTDAEIEFCKVCNMVLIIMEDGFPTCSECGVIYKHTLDHSPEWRFYGADDKNTNDPTRCGNPINPLLQESSFGCKIICNNKCSYEMKRIQKWTEWQAMPHKEKALYEEFQFITTMAQQAGIPKIFIDDAMAIHKDISEQKMFRGVNRDGIKSASIYISCRLNGCPRTAHEIAEIFHLDRTSATNGCSMAVTILHNIERGMEPNRQTDLCTTTPSMFIERYCSRLNINSDLTMLSKFIAVKIENQNIIYDNTPHSIAAGIIYFISQSFHLNISKMDIKGVCGVSEVTINKCFRKLENIKASLIPDSILKKYGENL